MKLLSVIVPVYNVEKYLRQCIESILNQEYRNIEVILVDDGSSDNSGKICDEYLMIDSRVKVIHKENGGQSTARNCGLDRATGDYIVFIDSDDFWQEKYLEKLMVKLIESDADMLMFRAISYLMKTNEYVPFSLEYPHNIFCEEANGKTILKNLLEFNYSFGWCPIWYIIKRKIIEDNHLRFREGYYAEDQEFTFRLWNIVQKVTYDDALMYVYRADNMQGTTCGASFKYVQNILDIIEICLNDFNIYNIENKYKDLLFLNYQSLIVVVLYHYASFNKEERKVLKKKINNIKYIFCLQNNENWRYGGSKCKIVKFMLRMFGIDLTGRLWGIKRNLLKKYN